MDNPVPTLSTGEKHSDQLVPGILEKVMTHSKRRQLSSNYVKLQIPPHPPSHPTPPPLKHFSISVEVPPLGWSQLIQILLATVVGPLDVSLQHLVSATQPKLLLTVLIIESSECNVINVTLHRQSTDGRSMVDRLSIDT